MTRSCQIFHGDYEVFNTPKVKKKEASAFVNFNVLLRSPVVCAKFGTLPLQVGQTSSISSLQVLPALVK